MIKEARYVEEIGGQLVVRFSLIKEGWGPSLENILKSGGFSVSGNSPATTNTIQETQHFCSTHWLRPLSRFNGTGFGGFYMPRSSVIFSSL